MIENRKNEWSELEAKAMEILENPRLLPKDAILKFYQPVLRVWIYPSFSPYKVWVFSNPDFKTIRPKNLKVIEVTWDKNEDYRRLNNPLEGLKKGFGTRPKLEIKSIEIESEVFESIYTELKQVQFSAFASEDRFGIDGVTYGIETFGFFCKTRIFWWSVYPEEWQNLVDWFEKTTKFLEDEFSKI